MPGRVRPAPENHLSAPPNATCRGLLRGVAALGGGALAIGAARADDLPRNLPPNAGAGRTLGAGIPAIPTASWPQYEAERVAAQSPAPRARASSVAKTTPLQSLFGIVTPSGLHFERHHAGMPDIDPHQHRLMIHGLVANPRVYTMEDIVRFLLVRACISLNAAPTPAWNGATSRHVQYTHGMLSCSEWTGVLLSTLLEEAGIDRRKAKFVLAEGADGASLTRTIPLSMALDDAIVCYGQNGEMIRPEQGFPLRLLVPGVQGVSSVKWLRRIKVGDEPWYTREESLHYVDLMPGGVHRQFTWIQAGRA